MRIKKVQGEFWPVRHVIRKGPLQPEKLSRFLSKLLAKLNALMPTHVYALDHKNKCTAVE